MKEFDKLYTFHIKLTSPDTPGFNAGHYVIYIRKAISLNKDLKFQFYFESANAVSKYKECVEKIPSSPDPSEWKGYAAHKYEDDIISRSSSAEDYLPVGRIQYLDFAVEIILKKSQHTTDVYFVSGDLQKISALYEMLDVKLYEISAYGIGLERGPPPAETKDNKLLEAVQNASQLMLVDASDIGRVY